MMVSHQGKWRIGAALAAMLLPLCVWAQTPPMIHYQGRLFRSSTGEPEEGLKEFRFRMVNTEAGSYTKLYWGEDQDVLVANGFYEVELGRVEPIPPEIFSATEVYLEIQVESDQAMTPRQRILAVPFAFQADLLDGMSSEEFVAASDFIDHASNPSAHHVKTSHAAEIVSGVFSEERIPSSIARQSALDAHKNDTNNPHKVNLQQAGAVTDHDLLINAKGYLGHAAIEAHIKGLANRPSTPRNDHACPSGMVQSGDSCVDSAPYRISGQALAYQATWFEAASLCAGGGKRLCLLGEWYPACHGAEGLGIDDIGSLQEWVDQWTSEGQEMNLRPVAAGQGSCTSIRRLNASSTARFRCCK